jgi:hypothetical protein
VIEGPRPHPGEPGFRTLPEAPPGQAEGRTLNREAMRRLGLAHDAGWSYAELADLYDVLRMQIEGACPGWRATRVKCSDGSHAFIGALGPVLVIMPDRRIYLGQLGTDSSEGAVYWSGLSFVGGIVIFPAPNPSAPGTRQVR